GVPYGSPLQRTREYVAIVRAVLAREEPLSFDGEIYAMPLPGGDGRALKLNVVPLRHEIPVYLAAMGPKNVALTREIADGWLPLLFSPDHAGIFELGELPPDFDVAPMVLTSINDDLEAARDAVRPDIALYVGAYGPRKRNFYAELVRRYGFEAEVDAIQGAALEGRMTDATAAVTDAMVGTLALAGPSALVQDRLQEYAKAGATSVLAMTKDPDTIRALGEVAE